MKFTFESLSHKVRHDLMGKPERQRFLLFRLIFLAFSVVSGGMTYVNAVTHFKILGFVTGIFAICCLLNFIMTFIRPIGITLPKTLFAIEVIAMFTFFIINGSPEGFSAFWAPLLSSCGILLFGFWEGLAINIIMQVIACFLCWIPAGRALVTYAYSDSFFLRFPLLYLGYMLIGILLGFILLGTQKAYYYASTHDAMTDALNRRGFAEQVFQSLEKQNGRLSVGFLILDLDHFKEINDKYGHEMGDIVLTNAARLLMQLVPKGYVCRWGGEEFAVFLPEGNETKKIAEKIHSAFHRGDYAKDSIEHAPTISIGAVRFPRKPHLFTDEMSAQADELLYQAKESGRDRIFYHDNTQEPFHREVTEQL